MHARPEYLLFTEALRHASGRYLWRFMLLAADSDQTIAASDLVDETSATRTELLALVRGLEAAEAPANIRLFTSSDYISRGLTRGLAQWRNQRWHWDRFGRRVPIRDCDLWQRVDHALGFHTVDCRIWGETDYAANELSLDATEVSDELATTSSIADYEPTVPASKRDVGLRRRRTRRNPLTQLRQNVEALLDSRLVPA